MRDPGAPPHRAAAVPRGVLCVFQQEFRSPHGSIIFARSPVRSIQRIREDALKS